MTTLKSKSEKGKLETIGRAWWENGVKHTRRGRQALFGIGPDAIRALNQSTKALCGGDPAFKRKVLGERRVHWSGGCAAVVHLLVWPGIREGILKRSRGSVTRLKRREGRGIKGGSVCSRGTQSTSRQLAGVRGKPPGASADPRGNLVASTRAGGKRRGIPQIPKTAREGALALKKAHDRRQKAWTWESGKGKINSGHRGQEC